MSGTSGINGTNGVNGTNGTSGSNGSNGTSGSNGVNGTNGIDGTSGVNGTSGSTGSAGTSGTSPVVPIVPQVQNATVAQRRNIDVYNGKYLTPNTTTQSVSLLHSPASQPIFFGAGNGSVHIIASGDSILRSTDNGLTWSNVNSDIFANSNYISEYGVCTGIIYIGNNTFILSISNTYYASGILYSTDNGLTWNISNISTYPNSNTSKSNTDSTAPVFLNVGGVPTIVIGTRGFIYYSIDNGVTFNPINPVSGVTPTVIINSIFNNSFYRICKSNGYFFAFVSSSTLTYFLYSTDGINWNYSGATPIALNIVGIQYNNGRYFINQTTNNNTYYTTDFISFTTVTRTPYFSTMVQASQAYNGNTIISVGNDVLKSTDNGNTWTSLFNDNGLTVFSGLVNGYSSVYIWFDGTRFNLLASVLDGSMVLLYDTDGTGTTWDFSPIDISVENQKSYGPNPIYLISNTRYITQIRISTAIYFKTVVRDTPGNGNVSIDICQSASPNDLGYGYGSNTLPNNYFNYKYINNRFIAPTSLYFAISNGSNPTQKWTRSLVKNTRLNNTTTTLNGVGFANGYWVGFGNGGILSTSPDLINWTVNASTQASSGTNSFSEMASIGSIGIVINESSNDVWTSSNVGSVPFTSNIIAGFSGGFRSIAASPSVFVVGGNGANVAYSTNGTSWTNVNFFGGTSATVNRIVYLNGKFIICHQYGVSVSSDGINWTSPFTSVNGPQMNNCVYTGTYWLACGNNNTIIRSSNGTNWSYVNGEIDGTYSGTCRSIASDGNGNVVLSIEGSNYAGTILVSDDHGLNWRTVNISRYSGPVIFGNGYFILSCGSVYYYSSNGGNTWNMIDSQNESIEIITGPGMKKVNGKYFAYQPSYSSQPEGSPGMKVADSLNGVWSTCKTGITPGLCINDIASNGNSYVAVCLGNKILRSVDGINFTDVTPKLYGYNTYGYNPFYFIEYANGIFIAGGFNGLLCKSTTGEYGTWTVIDSAPTNQPIYNGAYGNGIWVLSTPGKMLISSDNGTTWITSQINFIGFFTSTFVRFFNGFFYVSSRERAGVYRSSDGINWKLINTGNDQFDVTYDNITTTLEQDESTGYLYLFNLKALRISTDNGLTFNSVPANPSVAFAGYANANSIAPNYRQLVEDNYVYISMPPIRYTGRTMSLPYQFIGYPVL